MLTQIYGKYRLPQYQMKAVFLRSRQEAGDALEMSVRLVIMPPGGPILPMTLFMPGTGVCIQRKKVLDAIRGIRRADFHFGV
jgi:hypothetical protein